MYVQVFTSVPPLDFLRLTMVWAALAPLIWGRILFVLIPLFNDLGPMLDTFGVRGRRLGLCSDDGMDDPE